MFLGAYLRCAQAGESLWLDELHTSWVVADGGELIPDRAWAGNQSPLYFYLVWSVTQLLGHSPWTLRLPSLLAGIALIAVTYRLVLRWSDSVGCSLFAALIVAINRDCVFYSQEARPYALLQLSAAVHALIYAELLVRPTIARRVAFVIGAAWLFYLHYTAWLFLLAEAVCLCLLSCRPKSSVRYAPAQYGTDAVAVSLMMVPASATWCTSPASVTTGRG